MFHSALTLICNPDRPVLAPTLVDDVRASIEESGGFPVEQTVLSEGVAVDFRLHEDAELNDIAGAARAQIGDRPVDVVVQLTAFREKALLIADMDSTIIEQECIDELAEFVGKRSEISEITERAMRGEIDFEEALRARVAMLTGLRETQLAEAFDERISLTPGARTLVRTMHERGAFTALVSGGFTYFTQRVAEKAGFHTQQANRLEFEDGVLTGSVANPILGRAAKRSALKGFVAERAVDPLATLAVGDGANDLDMLGAAGLGVAFHAKPAVAEQADAVISHGDLTALLYLQGIPQAEFVRD